MLGVYVHIPFCASKCPYCDFYSLTNATDEQKDRYADVLLNYLHQWAKTLSQPADTLYFGGGTPSLLGAHRLQKVITVARELFSINDGAEITLEANPGDDLSDVFKAFAAAGGNRLSLGVQAVDDTQLRILGRRHTVSDVDAAVTAANKAGIQNVSLDLMLATSGQTAADIRTAARRFADWGATHVSAYLLKLENGTPYAMSPPTLPNDDEAATLYLEAVAALREIGFAQYEISNFAKAGFESRHNLKYWNLEPYIGIGPSAHSFIDGKRFYYPRSLDTFLQGTEPLVENPEDSTIPENSPTEYAMLRLRLCEGVTEVGFYERFGTTIPLAWRKKAAALPRELVNVDDTGIRLTLEGFLVSDAILAHIL